MRSLSHGPSDFRGLISGKSHDNQGPSFVEPRFCLNMTEKNTLVLSNLMFEHHFPIKTAVNLIYSLFMFFFQTHSDTNN